MAGGGGYRTPIGGFYLCGAGTHPGGAVMGAAGHNAAKAILRDASGASSPARTAAPTAHRDLVDNLASSSRLRGTRNWALRQSWLRPVVRKLSKK
jgi:hypothetical protein